MFHRFTGYDTASAFTGRGEKTAWETWERFLDLTEVFLHLSKQPDILFQDNLVVLEQFGILMYSKTCDVIILKVNVARQILFSQGSRNIENIPPTEAALIEHITMRIPGWSRWAKSTLKDPKLRIPV